MLGYAREWDSLLVQNVAVTLVFVKNPVTQMKNGIVVISNLYML
jgi:hypothetical protein